jgi:hypothetical protein
MSNILKGLQLNELSNEKLGQYKKAAGADAKKADNEGDYKRGDKRFSGIVKATKKQFANDEKKLKEFAPIGGDDREPNEEEILRQLAAKWWLGTEQEMAKAQKTLGVMGWEIGQDESGDDDAGVFVVRAGDENGNSYIAFNHSDLEELNEAYNHYHANRTGFTRPKRDLSGEGEPAGMFMIMIDGRPWKEFTSNMAFQRAKTLADKNPSKKIQVRWPSGQLNTVTEEQLDELNCWSGYHRVAGTKAGFPGSCAKNKTNEEGVAEGKVINTYLWHGSRQKIPMLEPRQSVDTGGAAGSNQNAIYATSDPKVAIAMGLTTAGSDTGMFPNDPQMVLFSGKIRKGEYVYLHKLPFNGPDGKPQFVQGGNSREFHSIPGVEGIKPIEIKEIPVNKYLNLIRKATPTDLKLRKKYMKKQGVAEEKCPHCGGEMVSEELMNEKKDACYYKVKSRYKVWPSAYASGALVKCRNKGASNWGNSTKNEGSILEGINRADESLHDWFNKEKWVRMDTKGNIKGPCAKEPGEGKPKCLPQAKAHSLGKKGRASAASRKRREDPNPERSGKAINVNTKKKD